MQPNVQMGWATTPAPSERPDTVFRRALPLNLNSMRLALIVLVGAVLMLVTVAGTDAAEPAVSTPTSWEYTQQTAPAAERQPVPSTSADLHLATGLSIAAVIVIAATIVSDRPASNPETETVATPTRNIPRPPATIRPLVPAEALPEAA